MENIKFILICSAIALIFSIQLDAQQSTKKNIHTSYVPADLADTVIKRFSNSETEGITFLVSSNLKENTLFIKTNYTGTYNIRFIDYWGKNHIDFENLSADIAIDLAVFERSIFIVNISDEQDNKLISSQIVNLRKKYY
jgi:hypothetical protein